MYMLELVYVCVCASVVHDSMLPIFIQWGRIYCRAYVCESYISLFLRPCMRLWKSVSVYSCAWLRLFSVLFWISNKVSQRSEIYIYFPMHIENVRFSLFTSQWNCISLSYSLPLHRIEKSQEQQQQQNWRGIWTIQLNISVKRSSHRIRRAFWIFLKPITISNHVNLYAHSKIAFENRI